MIMIIWQMMDGGSGGVSQFFIVKTFFNMAIGGGGEFLVSNS
jgi:hypothetical protein